MWKTGVVKFAIRQSGYLCDDYLFLAERMIQSYYLHVWTNPAQFVSNGVQNNHVNYLASRSEWQQLLPEAAMRTHCFSQPNTLSKFNQSCLNDDYIWKEVSKSLWWATHMNLAGISKAQREERHSSSLVYSTTRVSLTFSVRDLLRKHPPWSSKLSIILDTCWHLTQKPNTWRLCLSISCCSSYRKAPNLQYSALSPAIRATCICYSPSLPFSVFADHASGAQVIHWAETGEEHWWPVCHLFFLNP